MKSPERLGHSGDWRDFSRCSQKESVDMVILVLLALMVCRIVISIKIRLTLLD